jgi:hypothetical protein
MAAVAMSLWARATVIGQVPPVVPLAGLVVKGGAERCPTRDDALAHQLWSAVRAHYDLSGDTASVWTSLRSYTGSIPVEQVGLRDSIARNETPDLYEGWKVSTTMRTIKGVTLSLDYSEAQGEGERGMNGVWRRNWRLRIDSSGFAKPYSPPNRPSVDIAGLYERWEYAPLEAELASYFLDGTFGARNVMDMDDAGGGVAIRFCSAQPLRKKPWVAGVLTLRVDTTLSKAEWRLLVPNGDEGAGGAAEFGRVSDHAPLPPLLPIRSLYYRRQGAMYLVRQQTYDGWVVGPEAASVEDLRRNAAP